MLAKPVRWLGVTMVGAALCGMLAPSLRASDTASAVVSMHSDVNASTSLRVSSSVLTVGDSADAVDGRVLLGSIEFRAAARTRSAGEVVLTVDTSADFPALSATPGEAGAGIDFAGVGDGAVAGQLRGEGPQVAGRWVGSGVRTGHLVFSTRSQALTAGTTVPLRFVLSLP